MSGGAQMMKSKIDELSRLQMVDLASELSSEVDTVPVYTCRLRKKRPNE